LPEVTSEHVTDVVGQFRELIKFLEHITQRAYDENDLKRCLALSREATGLWSEVLNTAMVRPSPLTFFDATIYMGPIVVLRGTETARDYYRYLLSELQQGIASRHGAVKHRKEADLLGGNAYLGASASPFGTVCE